MRTYVMINSVIVRRTASGARGVRRSLALTLAAIGLLFAVVACGSDAEQDFIEDEYTEISSSGDVATYRSPDKPVPTAQAIANEEAPAARASDAGAEYLRYNDNIVIVRPEGSGSTITVEDLDVNFRNGAYSYLGPGFRPSDVPADGGPGDEK